MNNWNPLSPPALAAVIILISLSIIITPLLYSVNFNNNLIIEWEFISLSGVNIIFPALFDNISLIFILTVLCISLSVILFSTSYITNDNNLNYFIIIVILFVLSINLLILFPNIITLLLGWDGLGLSSYLLVIYYANNKSLSAGIVTALTNRIGDSLLIVAVSWLVISGQWNLSFNQFSTTSFIILTLLVATITNSAQLPFSAWLPAAIAAPTPVSALVHSSTLVTAGIYLLIRFYPSLSLFMYFQSIIFFVGLATCLIASLAATNEWDLKNIIALSTLSQLGVIIIAIGLNHPSIAFFHLVTHALFNALLFICAGNIIHSINNNQDIRYMGNVANFMPLTTAMLNIANISLCGLPFIAGFYSNDLIIETFFISNLSIFTISLIIISVCLTSAYTINLSLSTLWSPFNGIITTSSTDQSNISIMAYSTLILGAITSGALLSWIIDPSNEPMILPQSINIITIFTIILLGALIWININNSNTINPLHFWSSIWFLNFITTAPILKSNHIITNNLNFNELTWIETFSGSGVNSVTNTSLNLLQKNSHISFSIMLSTIILLALTLFALLSP